MALSGTTALANNVGAIEHHSRAKASFEAVVPLLSPLGNQAQGRNAWALRDRFPCPL